SSMWDHFTKDETTKKATCNLRTSSFCYEKRGSTSNLWRHKESKHSDALEVSKKDFDELCEKITRLVIVDNAAFRIVERPEFQALFPPSTRLPTRYHLSKVVMPSMVKKLRNTITEILTGKRVTLCMDQWTSKGGRVTLNCFNEHYPNIKEMALKMLPIPVTSVSAERVFSAA
ncbi:hypothetical protein PFISCL1PPCAC_23285, partial [Pristionchus fissidentatus]